MNAREKLLMKLLAGNADANFAIDELVKILNWFGFEARTAGSSEQIFFKQGTEGIINLQKTNDGKVKSYQVRQVREFLVTNKLASDEQI